MDENKLIRVGYKVKGQILVEKDPLEEQDDPNWINPRLRNERSTQALSVKKTSITKRVFGEEQIYKKTNGAAEIQQQNLND